jgi:REP element-mobilizing transposase RayT
LLRQEVFVDSTESKSSTQTEQLQSDEGKVTPDSKVAASATPPDLKIGAESIPLRSNGEPILQNGSELSYVCMLLPRFSDHFLIGDITESLVDWMKQICVSYGWRLDAIVVRPGYIQWIMIVPLNANPAQVMRIIRNHTSQRIFDDFPRFKQKNISGQFWAPGDFIVAGNQLQTLETINNFILQTRRYQGIV